MGNFKRYLSFLLAVTIMFSILPLSALAAEVDPINDVPEESITETTAPALTEVTEETTAPTETVEENKYDENLLRLMAEMDSILVKYLNATVLAEDEIIAAVSVMPWATMEAALAEEDRLAPDFQALTPEEIDWLNENYAGANTIGRFYDGIELTMTPSFYAATGTHNPVTDVTVGVSGATDNSMSNGAVTVTAKGSAGFLGIGASAKTATITVTNSGDEKATVAFDWVATSVNELKIDGTIYSATNGNFSKTLDAGGSVTITITSAKNNTTNKLVMSNFSWTAASKASNIIFLVDSGTITVAGETVANNTTKEMTAEGATIATSNSNFVAWVQVIEGKNKIIDLNKTYELKPQEDMTVRAVITTNACFEVDGYLYESLNDAASAAASCTDKTVVLMNNGTLPAGDYTIPSGVTLLIPFDSSNTVYTTTPAHDNNADWVTPYAYRTLTLAENCHLSIEGSLSLSAKHHAGIANGNCAVVTGPYGCIDTRSGSTITVKGGGALYAWGYITGSGSVFAKNSASVYEYLSVQDFMDGNSVKAMTDDADKYRTFLFQSYYIQNIIVPFTLYQGASLKGYVTFYMYSLKQAVSSHMNYIGPDSLFTVESGHIVMDYDLETDRMNYDLNGAISINAVSIKMPVSLWSITVTSSDYDMPITSNITININSGSTVNTAGQSIVFIPGSELNIDQGATFTVGSGQRLIAYDLDQWGNYASDATARPLAYVPGRAKTFMQLTGLKDAAICVNGTLDASAGGFYTTGGNANVYSTENGVVTNGATGTVTSYMHIRSDRSFPSCTAYQASLKNADTTYVTSANGTYLYNKDHGKWIKDGHTVAMQNITTPATFSSAAVMTYTCTCGYSYTGEIPAAQVGEKTYTILSEAIAVADRQNNVTLLTNIQGDVPVSKHVTFEMGDYSAKLVAADGFDVVENEAANTATVLIEIYATNIAPGDGLDMYFYVLKSAMPDTTGYVPVITREYADDDSETKDYEWDSSYNDDLYWRFCYEGIAAKEMTDPITAVVNYSSDGTPATTSYTETVQHYAARTLGTAGQGAELDTALIDMLNYGAGAQTYWGYNTDELANQDDSFTNSKISAYAQYATQGEIETQNNIVKGANLKAVSVSAKNKLMLTFYFENITEDMTATYSYTNHRGEEITKPAENYVSYGNWLGVDVEGLSIADGRQLVTCTVKEGDNVIASGSDSVEGYINRNSDNEVLKLLMKFIDSAYKYFH